MEWELDDGNKQHGSLLEESIIEAIRRGNVKPTAKVRPVGKEQWKLLGSHEPFARALEEAAAGSASVALSDRTSGGLAYAGGSGIRGLGWLVMLAWTGYIFAIRYPGLMHQAKGAPQEAVIAADTAVRLILGYIIARAVDRIGAIVMRERRGRQPIR